MRAGKFHHFRAAQWTVEAGWYQNPITFTEMYSYTPAGLLNMTYVERVDGGYRIRLQAGGQVFAPWYEIAGE